MTTSTIQKNNSAICLKTLDTFRYTTGQLRMINEWLGGISAFRAGKDRTLHGVQLHLPDNGCLAMGKYAPFPPQQVVLSQQKRSAYFLYQGFASMEKSKFGPEDDLQAVLAQYRTKANGDLQPLKPTLVLFPGTPLEAVVDPQSRYCYVFVFPGALDDYPVKTDKIVLVRYAIRSDGTLGRCSQQILTAPDGLFNPVFDSSGRILCLLTRSGIRNFRVWPDGSIGALSPNPIHAGYGPLGMIIVQR